MQGGKTPFGAGEKPGRAPRGRVHPAMRPVKSTQKGTFVWFGARRARKFKFSHLGVFRVVGVHGVGVVGAEHEAGSHRTVEVLIAGADVLRDAVHARNYSRQENRGW